jgi:signal transduction histidine kinase
MKIRDRLSWLLSISAFIVVSAFGWVVFAFDSRFYSEDFFIRLEERVAQMEVLFWDNPEEYENFDWDDPLGEFDEEKEFVFILDTDGWKFLESLEFEKLPERIVTGKNYRIKESRKSVILRKVNYEGTDYGFLVIAEDTNGQTKLEFLRRILIVGVFFTVVILVFVNRFGLYKSLLPLESKIKQASIIGASRLDIRLNVHNKEDEIGELTIAFNGMLDRLQNSFDAQRQFVRSASHEIKNPLTAIRGEIELILQRDRSIEEYKRALGIISMESERLENLTRQLLILEKADSVSEISRPQIFGVEQILLEVIEKFSPKKVKFDIDESVEDFQIAGNAELLRTALYNVVENGVKYSDSNKEVIVKFRTNALECMIEVLDHGIGIPEGEMKNIYQPLFRASNVVNYKGHGIGLPLAYKIILLHKGSISVTSKINEGTHVIIQLPRVKKN